MTPYTAANSPRACKYKPYEYQSELRLVLSPPLGMPFMLRIGSLEDIADICLSAELNDNPTLRLAVNVLEDLVGNTNKEAGQFDEEQSCELCSLAMQKCWCNEV